MDGETDPHCLPYPAALDGRNGVRVWSRPSMTTTQFVNFVADMLRLPSLPAKSKHLTSPQFVQYTDSPLVYQNIYELGRDTNTKYIMQHAIL